MPKHITYLLIGSFCFFNIGIVAGWKLSGNAYKPLLMTEHRQKVFVDAENIRIKKYYKHFAIEIEAHRQDMEVFKKSDTLMQVLNKLGIDRYLNEGE